MEHNDFAHLVDALEDRLEGLVIRGVKGLPARRFGNADEFRRDGLIGQHNGVDDNILRCEIGEDGLIFRGDDVGAFAVGEEDDHPISGGAFGQEFARPREGFADKRPAPDFIGEAVRAHRWGVELGVLGLDEGLG